MNDYGGSSDAGATGRRPAPTWAKIIFEYKVIEKGVESVTDVFITNGTNFFHLETKAGDEFFTFVATSGSNFAQQSHNMMASVDIFEHMLVPLNAELKATLNSPIAMKAAKAKVIKAWENWQGGKIFTNQKILDNIKAYGDSKFYDFSTKTELDFLKDTDEWFINMFRDTKL